MSNHGGKRKGAGRRPMSPGEKKIRQHLNLSPEAFKYLDTMHNNNKSAYVDALILEDMTMQELRRIEYTYGCTLTEGAYQGTSDDRMGRWYWTDMHSDVVDRRGAGYASKADAIQLWRQDEEHGIMITPYTLTHDEWPCEPEHFGNLAAMQAAVASLYQQNGWGRAPELDDDGESVWYWDREAEERVYVGRVEG